MVPEFKVLLNRNSDTLHVTLVGDFDGSSAHELVKAIKKHGLNACSIFIHTSGLRQISSFSRAAFQTYLGRLKNRFFGKLVFTGEYAPIIAPEESRIV